MAIYEEMYLDRLEYLAAESIDMILFVISWLAAIPQKLKTSQ